MRQLIHSLLLASMGAVALSAASITAVDSGWVINTDNLNSKNIVPGNLNYFAGEWPGNMYQAGAEFRNYFVFNLSGATGTISSATLTVPNLGGPNVGAPFTFRLYDVSTPVSVFASGTNMPGVFNDLGTGTQYGSASVLSDSQNPIVIALNAAGVAALNAAIGGKVAFGGDVFSGTTGDHYLFYTYPAGNPPVLSMDGTIRLTADTPEPGTTGLAVAGLGLLAVAYRRTRR